MLRITQIYAILLLILVVVANFIDTKLELYFEGLNSKWQFTIMIIVILLASFFLASCDGTGSESDSQVKTDETLPSAVASEPSINIENQEESNIPYNATMGQKNAIISANSYLCPPSIFSYDSLIVQLKYEGFTDEEATYAAYNCGADWNELAAEAAQSYLNYKAYSRSKLVEQLLWHGFTSEQVEYGVTAVGY